MAAHPANPQQALVNSWIVQLVSTVVLAAVVIWYFHATGVIAKDIDPKWPLYALYAATAGIIPPILYVRNFKHVLDVDRAATHARGGTPDPAIRPVLAQALRVGGALCALPQACGVVHLFVGGETRWFIATTMVSVALWLSYRPFERAAR